MRSDIADPLQRLQASHEANVEMKEHIKAVKEAGADISSVMAGCTALGHPAHPQGDTPPGRSLRSLRQRGAFQCAPGPKEALYLDNWKLANWFSTGQIADGTGLNITMWSYCGQANICMLIGGCPGSRRT